MTTPPLSLDDYLDDLNGEPEPLPEGYVEPGYGTDVAADPAPADDVVWQPHAGFQMQALSVVADEVFIGGAAGPGKTDVLLYGALRHMGNGRGRVLFLRRTYGELREVMDRAFRSFPKLGGSWKEKDKRWTWPSGFTLEFGYCETYADASRYQGQEYTEIDFDELGQVADERIVDFLCSRLRSTDTTIRPVFRGSGNPGGPGHAMLKRRYIDPTLGGRQICTDPLSGITRAFVPGRLSDNPSLSDAYRKRLLSLPERMRRQLLEGDWTAGEGAALDELDDRRHLITPFQIPGHWPRYAGFDWGFRHPWWYVASAVDPDGDIFVYDVAWGRQQLPHQIAQSIAERFPGEYHQIFAGHDCFHRRAAMDENTPTIAETFADAGLVLQKASIARVMGLNALRTVLSWRETGGPGIPGVPRLRFLATPRVLKLFESLKVVVTDPDNPEDALKTDANPDSGDGGDDAYDAIRYLVAGRPFAGASATHGEYGGGSPDSVSSFDPAVLAAEAEALYRRRNKLVEMRGKSPSWAAGGNGWEMT